MIAPPDTDTRIVIVDDTPDMRLLMRVLLDRYAGLLIVGEAENGVEAIELAQEHQPDIVLLDLAMPEMDGLEALPHIKRVAPDCQVIVLSGFGADHMASSALAAGATSYVQKGASPAELVAAIAHVAGRPVPPLKSAASPQPADARRPQPTAAGVAAHPFTAAQRPRQDPDVMRIIARTAHELRNPAITLTMLAEQLLATQNAADRDTTSALLRAIVRQATVLDRLTDDLLTSSQARRGALIVRPQLLDLRVALEETVAQYSSGPVALDCPPGLVVYADRLRLQQMVGNMLSNAAKYGAPPVSVTARIAGETVEIRVTDHGPGVPEGFRERMFDEFTRADPDSGTGTGLGLFIVASLAAAHGGSITLEPAAGATTFCLRLPHDRAN